MSLSLKALVLATALGGGTGLVYAVASGYWQAAAAAEPTLQVPMPGAQFDAGARLYRRDCAHCHGDDGNGNGELAGTVADFFPRSFRAESLRFVSTDNRTGSRADLLRTIRRGIPAAGMPPAQLSSASEQEQIADFVLEVRRLARAQREISGSQIPVPARSVSASPRPNGVELFVANCSICHGVDGRADAVPAYADELGRTAKARDLSRGEYFGGASDADLYWRIRCGLPGTAMPAFSKDLLSDEQVWALIDHLRSLAQ